jgi:hypothetical protein
MTSTTIDTGTRARRPRPFTTTEKAVLAVAGAVVLAGVAWTAAYVLTPGQELVHLWYVAYDLLVVASLWQARRVGRRLHLYVKENV